MLRRVHRLLLVAIAVVVAIAVTGPFRGIAGVRASIAITCEIAQARFAGVGSDDTQRHVDVARADGDDLEAIETEVDEEDDVLNEVGHETTTCALACVPERRIGARPRRLEIPIDTSRSSHRQTLARGPPV